MNSSSFPRFAGASAAAFLALLTLAPAARPSAGEPTQPVAIRPGVRPDLARVHLDRPGDGALWARGRRWKASFDERGATYYAGFGPRQPRNLAHALSPDRVTVGGEPIGFARAAAAEVAGRRVEIDRGAFVEAYELDVDSIEQLFVFESLPRAGAIVVRIPVASELDGVETPAGLEFRGDLGHVAYSRAVAIDARGSRAAAPTRLVDGAIEITVGADFLATAALPLVIDPVVTQFWLDPFEANSRVPDIAWSPFHQVWIAVYEEEFSASDFDVVVKAISHDGVPQSQSYVDLTSASWTKPRIANNGVTHEFLAVAERSSSTPKSAMGRIVTPNGTILTFGSQFDVGGTAPGDKLSPDVGGDPRTSGSTSYCVVFEHTVASGDSEIGYRLVSQAGVPSGSGPTYFDDASVERNHSPTLSRSNGGGAWLLAWIHDFSFPIMGGVRAARVAEDGTVASAPFGVSGVSNTFAFAPSASSPLAGSSRCLITFARRPLIPIGSTADVFVVALDGATILQNANLMTLESNANQAVEQTEPSVDSDGQHFLVAYSETDPVFGGFNSFATDLYLSGSQLGLAQTKVQLHPGLGMPQRMLQVAAAQGPAQFAQRYGIIYEARGNAQSYDVSAVLFDGVEGGSSTTSCPGDGSSIACPCGNDGGAGRGCANSVHATGASLSTTGVASTVDDTLRLQVSSVPASAACLFFQGTAENAAAPFGDGLLCTGGTTIRLATKTAASGSAQFPAAGSGDPTISVRGAVPLDGARRLYQVWYRNSAAFCTSATFNLSNGIRVDWAR